MDILWLLCVLLGVVCIDGEKTIKERTVSLAHILSQHTRLRPKVHAPRAMHEQMANVEINKQKLVERLQQLRMLNDLYIETQQGDGVEQRWLTADGAARGTSPAPDDKSTGPPSTVPTTSLPPATQQTTLAPNNWIDFWKIFWNSYKAFPR